MVQEWEHFHATGAAVAGAQAQVETKSLSDADLVAHQAACRGFLREHDCMTAFMQVQPSARGARLDLSRLLDGNIIGSVGVFRVQPAAEGNQIGQACELYSRVGCEAPSLSFLLVDSPTDLGIWRQEVSKAHKRLTSLIGVTRENSRDLEYFANSGYTPATIIGNTLALVTSILLTRRFILRFKSCVLKLRTGHPEGKKMQQIREGSGITATQIPKLVGMTIFSWLFNFLIISSLLTLLFSIFLGPWLPKLLTQVAGDLTSIVVELVVVALLVVVCLDLVVGKRLLFGGTDELMHPVTWTWYATIMLLFNIAKGAALAATRIAYMICLNLCQFAIVDKTSFPQGTEGMDPAYSSFVGMVFFAVKYRNPVLLSLAARHRSKTERQHGSQAHASARGGERGEGTDTQGGSPLVQKLPSQSCAVSRGLQAGDNVSSARAASSGHQLAQDYFKGADGKDYEVFCV